MENRYASLKITLSVFFLSLASTFSAQRVTDQLSVLYLFNEGTGQFIQDVSGNGDPLLLKIYNTDSVAWIPGGGIEVNGAALIKSLSNANKIGEACQLSNELTLEVWIKAANTTQDGPSRIMTVSHGTTNRNFMLGQKNNIYMSRVRTNTTSNNGTPDFNSPANSVHTTAQHLVYTLNADGSEKMYIDGTLVSSGTRVGNFSTWNLNYELLLGNETTLARTWLGEIYLSSVYSKALTESEVNQNFNSGYDQAGPSLSEETCENTECFIDGYGINQRVLWIPGLPYQSSIEYKFDETGGNFEVFDDGTAHLYGATWNLDNPALGWYIDIWLSDKMNWTEWSALGRGWKGDPAIVGNLYQDWDYYILNPDANNVLIGLGDFEGSTLEVSHKPENYYYGFQAGIAANDQNAMPGMSCWLFYTGNIDDAWVEGAADLNMEGDCDNIPVMSCAIDMSVDCESGWIPEITGTPILNCPDEFVLTYSDEILENECPVIILRTWSATNSVGDQIICEQNITVLNDNTAPVFTEMPSTITVNCDDIPAPEIDVTDECYPGSIEVAFEDVQFSGGCLPTIQRTYTATDACGNSSTFTQYIVVSDTTDPIFTNAPENLELTCGEEIPLFIPEVYDNCDTEFSLVMSENQTSNGCNLLIIRTWTATDWCGNSSSVTQTITITDNIGPAAENVEAEVYLNCDEIPESLTFEDACGVVAEVQMNDEISGSGCDQTIIRTYTASDLCGNTTILIQHIYISDTAPPAFMGVPDGMELPCGEDLPDTEPIAVDNCSDVTVVYQITEIESTQNCAQQVRTWLATDACGNTATASQLIQFIDTEAPQLLNVPQDIIASCGEVPALPQLVATDNCDTNIDIEFIENQFTDGCTTTIERTWTAMDNCGNTAQQVQTITLDDTEPPQFLADDEITISCQSLAALQINAFDYCAASVTVSFTDQILGSGCNYDIERTWLATDNCSNEQFFVQTIHILDSEGPVFTNIPPNTTLPCGSIPFYESPEVTDNCDSEIEISFNEILEGSACNLEIMRIWIATDNCGNSSTAHQVINIADTEAPIISGMPQNSTVECNNYLYVDISNFVTVTDNCDDNPVIVFSQQVIEGDCINEFQLIQTVTAFDNCGNTSMATYTVTVYDNTGPVFNSLPMDVTAECGNMPELPVLTASDNCGGEVSITFEENSLSGGCPIIVRTWIAEDACGNMSTATQQISIIDNVPPLLTGIPPGGIVSCNNIPPMPDPQATDNCDESVDISVNESIIGSGCEFLIIRTFIAEDDCGNSAIVSQSFTVQDIAPPVFVNPIPDITLECSELDTYPGPNVVDDCASFVIASYTDEVFGSGCEYAIERTYTAMDLCGNTATFIQTIHIVDNSAPSLLGVPPSTFTDCSNIPSVPIVTASDACNGSAEVFFSEAQIGSGCFFQIVRSWTATDQCGNSAFATQYIYVNDMVAPVVAGVESDLILDCTDLIPSAGLVTVTDNCEASSFPPTLEFEETITSILCGEIITRTWTATDACGNTSIAIQTITISDITPPIFSNVPDEVYTTCNNIPDAQWPDAFDNCSGFITLDLSETTVLGVCPYSLLRTWTATDACGNTSSTFQNIYIYDPEAPILIGVPQDITIECGSVPPVATVTAADNCSVNLTVGFMESYYDNGCTDEIERAWKVTDWCGNQTIGVQIITITDTQAPEFEMTFEALAVECDNVPPADHPMVTDCSNISLELEELIAETGCNSEYFIYRIWTATDECGHASSFTQDLVVYDHTPPVLSETPADLTVDCNNIPPIPEITATDNCFGDPVVTFSEEIIYLSNNDSSCVLGNTNSMAGELVVWLPDMSGLGSDYVFGEAGGMLVFNSSEGTAHLTGQVYHTQDANQSFVLDIYLREKRNWEEWSALGRSYKDELGLAGDNYLDWEYYELAETSQLIGSGAFEGVILNLSHAPINFYYGFQKGWAANNRNAEYGMSGWFYYNGVINGTEVNGVGDLMTENNCCPEQQIIRTWTVRDCAGNFTIYDQTIDVTNQFDPTALNFPEPETLNQFETHRNAAGEYEVNFNLYHDGQTSIELYDNYGRKIKDIFSGNVMEKTSYTIRFDASNLATGIYLFSLKQRQLQLSEMEVMGENP